MRRLARMVIPSFLLVGWTSVAFPESMKDQAQESPVPMLPTAVHVRGRVVGEDGMPIAKVRLYHIKQHGDAVTDSKGQFDFVTSAPSFVAQRPGFQSVFVKTHDATEFHIILHKASHPEFSVCSSADLSDRVSGWNGVFQIPKRHSVQNTREVLDVDYWSRKLKVKSTAAVIVLFQGRGPMWGGGDPDDELVWRSTRYEEVTYVLADTLLTDARGSLPNGRCWRELGVFSESVGYSDVDCDLVQPLDDLLDGTCVVPKVSEHLSP